MNILQYSRQTDEEDPKVETNPIFEQSREKKENIIPPVGIAKPELVDTFSENIGDDEKILKHIADVEAYAKETLPESAKRQTLAHGARAGEAAAGSIGDTQSLFEMLTGFPYPEREMKTREELSEFKFPTGDLEGPTPFAFKSPTTQELREKTKEATGTYLEPKENWQKASQEVASDFGSMVSPIAGELSWAQRLLLPLAGQTVKQSLKSAGVGETGQDIGRLSTIGILSIANLGNARQVAETALNQSRNMIGNNVNAIATPTANALNRLRNQPWFRTGRNATKAPAMDMIQRIEDSIHNGQLNLQDAMQLRIDLNHARRELGGFNVPGNPDRSTALRYLDEVDRALSSSMEHYGTNINPRWWNAYQQANEAFRVTRRSEAISNFLSSKYGKPLTSEAAKIAFGTGLMHGGIHIPLAGMGVGGVMAAAQSFKVINRMIQSPILRQHYLNVVRAASAGNAQLATKALEKFDKEAAKLEQKVYSKK